MIIRHTIVLTAVFILSLLAGCSNARPDAPAKKGIITLGEYKLLYASNYINDHAVVYDAANRQWHMFGIHGSQKSFLHLTSDSLTAPGWTKQADFVYRGREIWAPYVLSHAGKFWMFYTAIGTPREIVLSTSADLQANRWMHAPQNPVLARKNADGSDGKNKDPMILRDGDQWIMYYSAVKKRQGGQDYWVVGASTSRDLVNWSEMTIVFDENLPNDPGVESPFVVKRGKDYYLFLSARPWHGGNHDGGVDVFRSRSPFSWNPVTDHVRRFPRDPDKAHAPEIVRDLDGKWYMTMCGHGKGGWWIAPLEWNDGLD